MRQVALLRGINVGKHAAVGMAELRELLTGHGHGDVRTHLRSGNVVLTSDLRPDRLERALEEQIAAGMGVDIRVLVRTRDELAGVVERNPLAGVADNGSRYHVSFLDSELGAGVLSDLADVDESPERFVVSGREIYFWLPDGMQNARLTKVLAEKRLGVTATVRNWNTVTKLLALASESP